MSAEGPKRNCGVATVPDFTKILGNHTWFVLHALAASANTENFKNTIQTIQSLLSVYPCEDCLENYIGKHRRWFENSLYRLDGDVDKLNLLVFELHNEINKHAGNLNHSDWSVETLTDDSKIITQLHDTYKSPCQ